MGFPWLQCGGRKVSSASIDRSESVASSPPSDQASVGQHPRAAGVGHDRQTRAARPGLLGEHLGHVEESARS